MPLAEKRPQEAYRPTGGALDDIVSLRIFARVVELKSFSEVARQLDITPATVSKHISQLEAGLRARLVNRTTRHLFVTQEGHRLYERCVRVLRELEQAEADVAEMQNEPAGVLRVTAPLALGVRWISPKLIEFLKRYPRVSVDLDVSVRKTDLFQEHIDVGIRVAESIEPGLVAFELAPYRRVFCAAPDYLRQHGTLQGSEDLINHNCLVARGANLVATWPIRKGDGVVQVRVSGNLIANHGAIIRDAVIAGLGVAMLPRWMVEADLREGRLTEVLPGCGVDSRAIYAVLPQGGYSSPKIRVFVEFMKECFKQLC